MITFDYKALEQVHDGIEVKEGKLTSTGKILHSTVFRNYPLLDIEDLHVQNCRFENCGSVSFMDCTLMDSHFEYIETIYATRTPIQSCTLEHLYCDNDCIMALEDSDVAGCIFRDVELRNKSHLVNGVGDVWIDRCTFETIRTDCEDQDIFFCEEAVGKLLKRKKQFSIVDVDSCRGLEAVQYIGAGESSEESEAENLGQSTEKGLLTDVQNNKLRDQQADTEAFCDAAKLAQPITSLNLSVRTFNCLSRTKFQTLGDLVALNITQIQQIPNIGNGTIAEIAKVLSKQGIHGTAWACLQDPS